MANLKLTDTHRVILGAAGARESGLVLPLPKSLRVNRGTQTIVLKGLLAKDLIAVRTAQLGEEVWESTEDGQRTTLVIAPAGLQAIGLAGADSVNDKPDAGEPHSVARASQGPAEAKMKRSATRPSGDAAGAAATEPAKDSKLGILIAALRRKKGATIADLMQATGWQAHSVRGAISGALKKKLRLEVGSEVVDGRGRVYRIGGHEA